MKVSWEFLHISDLLSRMIQYMKENFRIFKKIGKKIGQI